MSVMIRPVLFLLLIAALPAQAHNGHVALVYPVQGITVDGDLSDWPEDLPRYPIASRPYRGEMAHVENISAVEGDEDFAASFRMGYNADENALYMAVEVQDQSVVAVDHNWGMNDWGAIVFDPDHDHGTENTFLQAAYGISGTSPQVAVLKGSPSAFSPDQVQAVLRQEATRQYYEWRVDIGQIASQLPPLQPGMVLGFETVVWDVDADTTTSYVYWGPEGQPFPETTTRLGDLLILGEPEDTGTLKGQVRWPDGTGAGRIKVEIEVGDESGAWLQVKTDRVGRFATPLPPGPYRVRALREEREIEVSADATTKLELEGQAALGHSVAAGPGQTTRAGRGLRRGKWRSWDATDGLIGKTIMAIVQDLDGAMWFGLGFNPSGASVGLVRYDGEQYTYFAAEDGFTTGNITAMVVGHDGHLWIGTERGLVRYDGQQFTTYTAADGLPADWVLSLLVRSDGSLWIGTAGGVAHFDGQQFTNFDEADGLPASPVMAMAEDRAGNLWLAASGLVRYDGKKWHTIADGADQVSNNFNDLAIDARGDIWAVADDGVLRYDGDEWQTILSENVTTFQSPYDRWIAAIEDHQGRMWLTSGGGGIKRLDEETRTHIDASNALVGGDLMVAYKDRDGRLWFSNKGGGIYAYDGQYAHTYTTADGLPDNVVMSVLEDRTGRIWFGTGDGLAHFEQGEIVRDLPEYTQSLWWVREDPQGDIWFTAIGLGVVHYDGNEAINYTIEDGLLSYMTTELLPDSQGRVWVRFLGNSYGISRYDGEQWQTFTMADGLVSGGSGSMMVEDRAGQIWFGTNTGLNRFDGERFTAFTRKDGLPHDQVRGLALDPNGDLWFSFAGGGFARYRSPSPGDTEPHFDFYDLEQEYTKGQFMAEVVDDRGHLWLGAWGGGVVRFDGLAFQTLRRDYGLPGSAIQDIAQTSDGAVWIGHSGGVTRYIPRHTQPTLKLRNVVADQAHGPVAEIELPSTQDYLLFEFQGASLNTTSEDFIYIYRLKGYQDEWRQINTNRVEFRNLPVGEYLFEVKAVDHDLNYSKPVQVKVVVHNQLVSSSVAIASVEMDDLFASYYKGYAEQPFGKAVVANHNQEAVETTLRFFVPGLMRRPLDQKLVLAPESSQEVVLTAVLEPSILAARDAQVVSAEVSVAFASGEQTISIQETRDITVHGRGALRWDDVGRAAAFVTTGDEQVAAFARQSLVAFEEQIKARGKPLANLTRAMVLFEALKAHGLRYLADANSPYAQATSDRSVIDHIQYPAELLQSKSGDCDDLTVLYASLLENAGVPTALVDYPGHIFLLFDTGIGRQEAYKLPMDARQYVIRGDRVWIPVEITRLDQPFAAAWKQGLDELARLSERDRRKLVVDTADAWATYPPANLAFTEPIEMPARSTYENDLLRQHGGLLAQIDEYIDETWVE